MNLGFFLQSPLFDHLGQLGFRSTSSSVGGIAVPSALVRTKVWKQKKETLKSISEFHACTECTKNISSDIALQMFVGAFISTELVRSIWQWPYVQGVMKRSSPYPGRRILISMFVVFISTRYRSYFIHLSETILHLLYHNPSFYE